jgi:hypothetical protein
VKPIKLDVKVYPSLSDTLALHHGEGLSMGTLRLPRKYYVKHGLNMDANYKLTLTLEEVE